MNNKHNIKTSKLLSILLVLTIMFVIPFSMGANDNLDKPEKIKIDHKIENNKNVYEASNVKIKSNSKNTINMDKAILNKNYISIPEYDKKDTSNYEISFQTDNNGVEYYIYKSDLTDVSVKEIKKNGNLYAIVTSENGFVTFNTQGFSSFIMSMPNLVIPFFNTAEVRLNQYFDFTGMDHIEISYYDPTDESYEVLLLDESTSYTEGYNFALTEPSTGFYVLSISVLEDYVIDSGDYLNGVSVSVCDDVSCTSSSVQSFFFETPADFPYYRQAFDDNYKQGMHDDIIDYFDFNNNKHLDALYEPTAFGYEFSRFQNFAVTDAYSTTPSTWSNTAGIIGGAYDYNGASDYIPLPSQTGTGDAFTLSAWFKSSQTAQGEILSRRTSSITSDSRWISLRADGSVNGYINDGTGISVTSGTGYNDDVWHHAVLTYDGTTLSLYVDGGTPVTDTGSVSLSILTLDIGRYQGRDDTYFDGLIDEVLISDKAFSQEEILFLYNSGNSREFHTLNTPTGLGYNICYATLESQCGFSDSYYFGALPQGQTDFYLDNLFNFQGLTEKNSYVLKFWDPVGEVYFNITHGGDFVSPIFDLALDTNDLLSLDFKENTAEVEEGTEIIIYATSPEGYTEQAYIDLVFPSTIATNPPTQVIPIGIAYTYITGFDLETSNITLYLSTYFTDYTDVHLEYYDENLGDDVTYFIELDANVYDEVITQEIGNLSVTLDPTLQTGEIALFINSIEGKEYNGEFYINVSNSAGYIDTNFDVIYQLEPPSSLINTIISNQSVLKEEMVCVNSLEYFYNVTKSDVLFEYNNISYNQSQIINYALVGPPTAITNETDGFIAYFTELGVFCFEAKNELLNLSVTMYVYDDTGKTANQNFYINVLSSLPMTDASNYLYSMSTAFTGLFPNASNMTTLEALGIVVLVMLIVTILIIVAGWKRLGTTSVYLAVGVDILLFLLFAGLNYISTGFLILIGLLLIGLSYLKMRG